MSGNPLKPIVFVSFLSSLYTLYQVLIQGIFQLFAIAAVITSSIFIFLYFKLPKYAGAFMFYSAIPVYPIYFLASAISLITPPSGIGIYLVLGVIYIVCIFVLWKLKNRYEAYLLDVQANTVNETTDQPIN
jgi:hypothetical protein